VRRRIRSKGKRQKRDDPKAISTPSFTLPSSRWQRIDQKNDGAILKADTHHSKVIVVNVTPKKNDLFRNDSPLYRKAGTTRRSAERLIKDLWNIPDKIPKVFFKCSCYLVDGIRSSSGRADGAFYGTPYSIV
jgi:hypothetical protein